jgi:putative flippase GtrA
MKIISVKQYSKCNECIREGGLYVIVCNAVTVLKYMILQFLPYVLRGIPQVDFYWPGIRTSLFGISFLWNIVGYDAAHGGFAYFLSYMIAMILGECINFLMQRNFVFKSKGNLQMQMIWYTIAFIIITVIVNSVNCVWIAVAGNFVPDFVYNIGTTVLNGGVSMVIFFFVNKAIFPKSS